MKNKYRLLNKKHNGKYKYVRAKKRAAKALLVNSK